MIDISNWKEFKISDVFITEKKAGSLQTPTGSYISQRALHEGETPRVTVSNFNNGITGYYKDVDDNNYRVYDNFISVSFLGTVFYQPNRASLDMKVHCLKPIGTELNQFTAGFIVSVVRKTLLNIVYTDQLSSSVLPNLTILLPQDDDGKPNWEYMENYMRLVTDKVKSSLNILKEYVDE